ncbi:DUF7660 family protein [Sphingobacterium lactis]|uniref:DUF7660 family protein n=1 Tax=Sphingobacterium lactis TaxID=797291 RepID=UPI003F7F016B
MSSKQDFLKFISLLRENLEDNSNEWENNDLESFLTGLEGYCIDYDGDDPSWRVFAELLLAARVYE